MTIVLFHRTGYPQYHIVPIVLGSAWLVRNGTHLAHCPLSVAATGSYFTWMAAYDIYNALTGDGNPTWHWNEARQFIGLPAFLFGLAFILGVTRGDNRAQAARVKAASTPVQSPPPQ
jgi:hypothetical protein